MPERTLVAHADGAGRVWIEDAEHGRFPPDGIFISFPQCERKRDVKATFALAKKMAAALELLEALELAEQTLGERHWGDIAKARVKAKAAIAQAEFDEQAFGEMRA